MLKQVSYLLKLKAQKLLGKKKKDIPKEHWEWTWWRLGLIARGREVVTSPGWLKIVGRLYWKV